MLGFYARADSTKPIRTDLDKELIGECQFYLQPQGTYIARLGDARWFTRKEIESVVWHKKGSLFRKDDYHKMSEKIDGRSNIEQSNEGKTVVQALHPGVAVAKALGQEEENDEPPFKIPPETAIAGTIIRDWMAGKVGFPPGNPEYSALESP
jgi:NAD+ diphosphatase